MVAELQAMNHNVVRMQVILLPHAGVDNLQLCTHRCTRAGI